MSARMWADVDADVEADANAAADADVRGCGLARGAFGGLVWWKTTKFCQILILNIGQVSINIW